MLLGKTYFDFPWCVAEPNRSGCFTTNRILIPFLIPSPVCAPYASVWRIGVLPKRVSRISSTSTMTGEQLITLFLQRSLGLFQGRRKCVDAGRGSASREAEGLKSPPAPTSAFCPPRGSPALSHYAPFGRVPAHALRKERLGNAERCARRPGANFLQVQLGHPRGGGDAGLRGRRGAPGES